MRQIFVPLFYCLFSIQPSIAQMGTAENLVVITLDGMRWQELFGGVDSALMNNKTFTPDSREMQTAFWDDEVNERRNKLFPFIWNTIQTQGQIYGNRWIGSNMDVANRYHFSYPGYNEIFTGYPDTSINSNDKKWNENINVLEFINRQKGFEGKVAAFATWDVFPYILNSRRSGVYVNADVDTLRFASPALQLINDMQFLSTKPIGVRPDVITYMAAREYLKEYKPRVLCIAFDETDDFAHGGQYDQYIKSARAEDGMIADLWNTLQSMWQYKAKTAMIITCDHGRGDKDKSQWKSHGEKIEESSQIWMAAIGAGIQPLGEVKQHEQLYQKQLAATMAAILGFDFTPVQGGANPIRLLFSNRK